MDLVKIEAGKKYLREGNSRIKSKIITIIKQQMDVLPLMFWYTDDDPVPFEEGSAYHYLLQDIKQ